MFVALERCRYTNKTQFECVFVDSGDIGAMLAIYCRYILYRRDRDDLYFIVIRVLLLASRLKLQLHRNVIS